MFNSFFKLAANGTSVRTEVIAGFTTFLTMAYVIVVNPQILNAAGMNQGAVFVATCIAAGVGCVLMGLFANYPVALAPTMGMNAYFTYAVVKSLGYSWQVGLGAVFISGVLFLLLTLLRWRQWIINTIPAAIKLGIVVGIGIFLGVIALKNIGVIVLDDKMAFHFGSINQLSTWLCLAGFVLIILLNAWKIPGAIMVGIITVTVIGIALGLSAYRGIIDLPPSMAPTFLEIRLSTKWDIELITVIFTFFFVALFDATGTLIGTLSKVNKDTNLYDSPNFGRALTVESIATILGSLLGTSTTGIYVESAAGVSAGGRTGLTAVVTGLLFFGALFLAPLAETIPSYATAAALLFVACLMAQGLKQIAWHDFSEWVPSLVTIVVTPLLFSVARGISWGFISYVVLKLVSGKYRQLNASTLLLTGVFVFYLVISS